MSSLQNNVKTAIATQLAALVTAGSLGAYIEEDLSKNVLDLDFPAYPCAVLGMASVDSAYEFSQANLRTYQFDILVVMKGENVVTPTDVEDTMDAILTQFDNNFTLGGVAQVGIEATTSPTAPVSSKGKTYIVFNVRIKAKALQSLTYNF